MLARLLQIVDITTYANHPMSQLVHTLPRCENTPESALADACRALLAAVQFLALAVKHIYTLPRAEDYLAEMNSTASTQTPSLGWMSHDAHFPHR